MSIQSEKKLGFGTMRLPLTDPEDPKSIDLEEFRQMADLYMERGFCYVDTAYPYHDEHSEDAVRQCIVERYPREKFLLADKMPIIRVKSAADYERFFSEQLRRCGVSYFDVYLLHNLGRDRYPNTERFGGFSFLKCLKEQGLAKNIGFSGPGNTDTTLSKRSGVFHAGKGRDLRGKHGEAAGLESCRDAGASGKGPLG